MFLSKEEYRIRNEYRIRHFIKMKDKVLELAIRKPEVEEDYFNKAIFWEKRIEEIKQEK